MGNQLDTNTLAYCKPAYYSLPMQDDQYLTRSLGFLLGDVARLMRRRFDARSEELGLTRAQWRVLAQLRRREGINQSTLAELLEVEPITMGRHIDRLVTKGLVERRPDPKDRRVWRLYLNSEVQPVLDSMREISEQTRGDALAGIDPEQRETLIDNLLIIKANLSALEQPLAEQKQKPAKPIRGAGSKVHGA